MSASLRRAASMIRALADGRRGQQTEKQMRVVPILDIQFDGNPAKDSKSRRIPRLVRRTTPTNLYLSLPTHSPSLGLAIAAVR